MMMNFEKEIDYFLNLVEHNIKNAKTTKKSKTKAIFFNLNLKLDGEEIAVYNMGKKYAYTLYTKEIQDFNFKRVNKSYVLYVIERLTLYANNKIKLDEILPKEDKPTKNVRELLKQKNNISEQLRLLRRYSTDLEVHEYIDSIYIQRCTTKYIQYLIDRYYFNIKGLKTPKRSLLERTYKTILE